MVLNSILSLSLIFGCPSQKWLIHNHGGCPDNSTPDNSTRTSQPRTTQPRTTQPSDNSTFGQLHPGQLNLRTTQPADNSTQDNSTRGQLNPRTTQPADNSTPDNPTPDISTYNPIFKLKFSPWMRPNLKSCISKNPIYFQRFSPPTIFFRNLKHFYFRLLT